MPAVSPPCHDAIDQAGGAIVAERLGQHGLDRLVVHRDGCTFRGVLGEFVDHRLDTLARDLLQGRHGVAQLLDFLGSQVAQNFGGFVLAQGEQQDGALFYAFFRLHRVPPSP
jgi:hypothetical protein